MGSYIIHGIEWIEGGERGIPTQKSTLDNKNKNSFKHKSRKSEFALAKRVLFSLCVCVKR